MYDLTYAGLIEGAPNERLNTWIMERALTHHEALWGERQIHMIPPAIDVSDPARPPCLDSTYMLLLTEN